MFTPFCFYALFSISFMYFTIKRIVEPQGQAYPAFLYTVAGIIVLILWVYHVYLDCRQLNQRRETQKGLKTYFNDIWNLNDLLHLSISMVMVATNLTEEPMLDVEYQIVLASIGSFSICIKFYDWLRLFDRTSFYINLISMTIIEINYFLILYLASFFMFGFPLLMLNLYRTQDVNLFERNSYYQIISMVLH